MANLAAETIKTQQNQNIFWLTPVQLLLLVCRNLSQPEYPIDLHSLIFHTTIFCHIVKPNDVRATPNEPNSLNTARL